ncbi:protein mono-ADP-ribosyltransferase PARP16-like [Periplaneta americana]|uniref:protein mono-ADP-ribosyltransferase PARP16-like n=1 Tax=Periplaneta americana TaxID=6978 RepID=UPI0037E8C068
MQGDQSKTLTETSTLHRNHRAADGINVTTGTPSARANIGDRKSVLLQCVLEKDPQAADVKWSLFVAACQSYRYDSCLKPFPPQFIINGAKDIDSLREVVDKTPALSLLAQHLNDPDVYQANPQVIDLLYWVLVHLKDVRMKSVPKLEFDTIMEYVHCETAAPAPNLIFQLVSDPQGTNEVRWQQVSKGYKTLYAFHGSRLDNFHSILHYGLQKHLNKNSLFGHGIYLSSELSVSLPYSPMGYSWGRSIVGSEMSCVALCEVVNHPDVKCQDKESDRSRSIAKDSIGGEVPNKYYVALNSDLVKVRYLLIYSKYSQRASSETSSSWLGWLGRHKLLTFILGYIVVLASVGLSNNDMVQRYYHLMLKRVGL